MKSNYPTLLSFIGWSLLGACAMFIIDGCTSRGDTLLMKRSASFTGIEFNNKITENDSINSIDLEFLYNGGGVAAGDFNNDGLCDLYFTGSEVSNKLYLNKGKFKFSDVTEEAGVTESGRWANAVSIVDVNNDGWLDMYITNTIKSNPEERKNLFYINQGLDKNGIPHFKDMAEAYGLADTSYSVHAGFFDYDNDGDLDMYLLTTKLARREGPRFFKNQGVDAATRTDVDKLFRNDWDDALHHPVFTDVSKAAGIVDPGFGLGMAIADINRDGWKDIYVTNDFFGSDLLYINNKNGTFTNKISRYFKHTSQNAMGNDIADINNDGLADIIAVDMNPEDNLRKKTNMNGSNYNIYQNMVLGGYTIQYVRNTLQLNMGPRRMENDSIADPVFGDIGFYAGIAETDWSWNPSIADFDNDGNRDIIITNGYPRDVTDHDFVAFRKKSKSDASKHELIDNIPIIKINNYAFRNDGNLHFTNMTKQWGFDNPGFSNGGVYADLDNDGDLDYVINNINDPAEVYENTLRKQGNDSSNYLQINFKGPPGNILGLGAFAELHYGKGQKQVWENSPYRGYLSSVEPKGYFGLGAVIAVDSLIIEWPGQRRQVISNIKANQLLTIDYKNSSGWQRAASDTTLPVFTNVTKKSGVFYHHRERDYIDFDEQRLLPHKLSQYGPGLAAGDINGDGLDDIIIGGTGDNKGKILYQQADEKFSLVDLPARVGPDVRNPENMGILLFDADGDNDLDVYFASGSNESFVNSKNYQDLFLVNKGNGKLEWDSAAIPINYTSKSCVKGADYDRDGDLDLFIGGRLLPGGYPQAVSSFIYRNDSKDGVIKFTNVTDQVARDLINVGMVCDAIWTDFDSDGWKDLILAGEWMPLRFLKNQNGIFSDITDSTGASRQIGWWNSITGGDFDNDGDIDYVAGNLGKNSYFRGNADRPVSLYAKDFDNNKSIDIIPTLYLKSENGRLDEFPAHTRDDIVEQLPGLKKRFLTYKAFGKANIHSMFSEKELADALILKANFFESVYIRNDGKGRFALAPLPSQAQLAPVFGMIAEDVNADGNLDLVLCGNDYGNEVANGRYDAMNGLVMLGKGNGQFDPQSILTSGIFIPEDAKALVKLSAKNGSYLVAASQNKGLLQIFKSRGTGKAVPISLSDDNAILTLTNGKKRKDEFYFGNSFLSQSARFIYWNPSISSIEIYSKTRDGNNKLTSIDSN